MFGPHLILDITCKNKDLLNNHNKIFELLNNLPDYIGMTKITQPYVFPYKGVVPDEYGITGVVIIAESHISIHTFPEKNYLFMDIFSCKSFNTEKTKEYILNFFESQFIVQVS